MMRPLVIPSVLMMAPLTLGCSDAPTSDAATDLSAVVDVTDVADAAMDVGDAMEESGLDIQFSERRVDVSPPEGAMCFVARDDAGRIECRGVDIPPGSGFLCLRYLCEADDGGSNTDDCCRLVT